MEFLSTVNSNLKESDWTCRCDIFYLTDFFGKMNETTLKLQGKHITLEQCKCIIRCFANKLRLCRRCTGRRQFDCFSHLKGISKVEYISDEKIYIYTDYIGKAETDISERFRQSKCRCCGNLGGSTKQRRSSCLILYPRLACYVVKN